MPNAVLTRDQKAFFVLESVFGTAVTPVGANACLITSLTTQASQGETPRPDKTGSLGETVGTPSRKNANWSASMSAAANGAANVGVIQPVFPAEAPEPTSPRSRTVTSAPARRR